MTDLKPCEFCKSPVFGPVMYDGRHAVPCKCGAQGPFRSSGDEAEIAWNTRQSDERIAELERALKPFAEYGRILKGQLARDDVHVVRLFDTEVTVGEFRNAASTLKGNPDA